MGGVRGIGGEDIVTKTPGVGGKRQKYSEAVRRGPSFQRGSASHLVVPYTWHSEQTGRRVGGGRGERIRGFRKKGAGSW